MPRVVVTRRRALVAAIAVLFAALAWGGYLYPMTPTPLIEWWVVRVAPLGSGYETTRARLASHGWKPGYGTGPCTIPSGPPGSEFNVELGHFVFFPLPAVTYAYATFRFDEHCRLCAIDIVKEAEGP